MWQASEVLKALFPSFISEEDQGIIEITQTTHPRFGHYQCNTPMKMAKKLGRKPVDIAREMVERWIALYQPLFALIEVAGPGFINLTFSLPFLVEELVKLANHPRCGVDEVKDKKKVVVEFSSPNVAKELHVGHLRSTIIGDSLARLFEFLGHEVLRLNHIGDWGTQFGMLIAYLYEREREVFRGEKEADLSSLMRWYQEAKQQFDRDIYFKERARRAVVALQGGEPSHVHAWRYVRELSRKGFQEIYQCLDVQLVERGESYYNSSLPLVVEECENMGLIVLSEGAKCCFLEGFSSQDGSPLPLILQKKDGGYNYVTTDLAAVRQRVIEEKADHILYVVDAGQRLHFEMIFRAAQKAGYYDPEKVSVRHVPFGLVLGPDGKKFKTRSGNTERLIDLLQDAIDHASSLLDQRDLSLSEGEREELAHILGINSVKYADLSSHRTKDYLFSHERLFGSEQQTNTASYLLYSYVRIQGIKRKVNQTEDSLPLNFDLSHPAELGLALHLLRFGEVVEEISTTLLPHRLADYLYGLAEQFHHFFKECRVQGSSKETSRLALCMLTSKTLKQGMEILGLKVVDRM